MVDESVKREWYVTAPRGVAELDTIEISHPNFSQNYYLVRNNANGLIALDENNISRTFVYCPMIVKPVDNKADLDQVMQITLADLNETIGMEIDNIPAGNTIDPVLIYRSYRSDSNAMIEGPITLNITAVNFVKQGANITAQAISFNISPTGDLYDYDRFPQLRGFI